MESAHTPGIFNWVDLHAKDVDAAADFYQELFGWDIDAASQMFGGSYNMAKRDGKLVCGIGPLPPTQSALGVPAHWNTYVAVESADKAAEKVKELGGTVMLPPMDVAKFGRMAVIQDPDGAVLALWEGRALKGAEVFNQPNTHCWNELYTRKVDACAAFYEKLLGWTVVDAPASPGPKMRMVNLGGKMIGTIVEIQKEMGDMPANWAVYFAVESCDATLEAAKKLGANMTMPPMDVPQVGRFAGLQDPQGAHVMIIQLAARPA